MACEDWPFDAWSLHGNKDVISRYEILERIGEGTYGEVHKARRREDSLLVALKEIHNSDSSCREIKALLLLDHPNVVKLLEYFSQGSNMVLVLEYLPYNLYEVIQGSKGELTDGEVKGWMIQILQGLAACHSASILHRDLKPNNLLISEDRILKIADFGTARVLSDTDFVNGEGLSESQKNYVTGSEGQSSQEMAALTDGSVLEGRMGDETSIKQQGLPSKMRKCESSGDVCTGLSQFAGRGKQSKAAGRNSVLRESENLEGNLSHLESGPTNVGYLALADAVKDAKNYFTIEEMVRSGTGMDVLGLSDLHKQHIVGSQNTEEPSCCVWFPSENVEIGVNNWSPGNRNRAKNGTSSVRRDHEREGEKDVSSDESDGDWKGMYGVKTEDLMDTLKETEERCKSGVSSSTVKADGDFLQKLRRFIKKRTRKLNAEGKMAGTARSRSEKLVADGGGRTPERHTSPGSRKTAFNDRNVAPSAVQTEPQRRANANENTGIPHGKERKSSKLCEGPLVANGSRPEVVDEVSAASRPEDEYCAQQSLKKEEHDLRVPKESEGEVSDDEEEGDLRTESGRRLYGGLQVETVEKKPTTELLENGPLRQMAYATMHEVGVTAATCKSDTFQVNERESEVKNGGGQSILMDLEKSKEEYTNAKNEDDEGVRGFPGTDNKAIMSPDISQEVLGGNNSAIPDTWDNVSPVMRRWDGTSAEPILFRDDDSKSWTGLEGYNSMSDSEGTRWFGAPEFQYSYMDSNRAGPGVEKQGADIHAGPIGTEDEWAYGAADGRRSGGDSQESVGRGNIESDHGSDFTTIVGTRWYKAPELLYGATKYGEGIDVWAVGCMFGELLLGKPLFPGLNDIDQLSRLVRILGAPNEKIWVGVSLLPDFNKICFVDDRSPLTLRSYLPQISEAALNFLLKLLTYDPLLRPSAEKALDDEFFRTAPLPTPFHELQLPTKEESEASDEEWGDWKDPGSPFSDFEVLG